MTQLTDAPTSSKEAAKSLPKVAIMVAGYVTFGILSATTTGLAPAAATQQIIGHEPRTAGYGSRSLVVIDAGIRSSRSSADQLLQVRESSGLTWDQLARLFGVSRRAVHHWASGDNMNAHNHELLTRLTTLVGELPGETPAEKRSELLRARDGGKSAFDLFRDRVAASGVDINDVPITLAGLLGVPQK